MAREICWLTLTLALTLSFWIPYVLNRMVVRGLGGTFANPSREAKPLVAVSVYHRPEDLWKIPSELQAMNPDYRLFLRTLGHDGMDVICYAVPPECVDQGFDQGFDASLLATSA